MKSPIHLRFGRFGFADRDLRPQLDALQPRHIVAMDRQSQKASLRWDGVDLTCFTRKRDAHDYRAAVLKALRASS